MWVISRNLICGISFKAKKDKCGQLLGYYTRVIRKDGACNFKLLEMQMCIHVYLTPKVSSFSMQSSQFMYGVNASWCHYIRTQCREGSEQIAYSQVTEIHSYFCYMLKCMWPSGRLSNTLQRGTQQPRIDTYTKICSAWSLENIEYSQLCLIINGIHLGLVWNHK